MLWIIEIEHCNWHKKNWNESQQHKWQEDVPEEEWPRYVPHEIRDCLDVPILEQLNTSIIDQSIQELPVVFIAGDPTDSHEPNVDLLVFPILVVVIRWHAHLFEILEEGLIQVGDVRLELH